jgi:hypothetical protein
MAARTPADDEQAASARSPLNDPHRQVFRREGDYWTIEYGGTIARIRDSVGLRHIAFLLRRAGETIPSTELIRVPSVPPPDAREVERARVTATRAIRAALHRLGDHHPLLREHFNATIRTGATCSYRPDPRLARRWEL